MSYAPPDPILGIIAFDLAEMFHHTSQVTRYVPEGIDFSTSYVRLNGFLERRTMPIVGGLGYGLRECIGLVPGVIDI